MFFQTVIYIVKICTQTNFISIDCKMLVDYEYNNRILLNMKYRRKRGMSCLSSVFFVSCSHVLFVFFSSCPDRCPERCPDQRPCPCPCPDQLCTQLKRKLIIFINFQKKLIISKDYFKSVDIDFVKHLKNVQIIIFSRKDKKNSLAQPKA